MTLPLTNMRFFLDESGHSGDLARNPDMLDFGGQPVFALACVGVPNEEALLGALQRLRVDHRFAGRELKSGALGARLPAIGGQLARILVADRSPLFVEVVEKRFFIAIHIVNHLLCGGMRIDEVDLSSRNMLAEFIADHGPDALFNKYREACDRPDIERVRAVIDLLWQWTDSRDERAARQVQILTLYARDRATAAGTNAADFLPIADAGPSGKRVWMLPNLQCLTNIYARINQHSGPAIGGAELIHDEQLQYGKVLSDAKAMMEALAEQAAIPLAPFADYRLKGIARLSFASSLAEPCIQAADLLAGFTMRFVRDALGRGAAGTRARSEFFELLAATDPARATGINFVMTRRDLERAGIPTF